MVTYTLSFPFDLKFDEKEVTSECLPRIGDNMMCANGDKPILNGYDFVVFGVNHTVKGNGVENVHVVLDWAYAGQVSEADRYVPDRTSPAYTEAYKP